MAQEQAIPSIGPAAPEFALPHRPGVLRNVLKFIRRKPLGALGFFFVLFMIAMTRGTPKAEMGEPELPHSPLGFKLGQPWLAPYSEEQNFKNANGRLNTDAAPSTKHWLGTDGSGRDNWTRVVWGARRSMLFYILPNIMASVIVVFSTGLGVVILAEAALAFIVPQFVPQEGASWGLDLGRAQREGVDTHTWPVIAYAGAIALSVLGFNLAGDALRDVLDPRLRVG